MACAGARLRARGRGDRLAGGARLPVDAVALVEERARQYRLSAGLLPDPTDLANFVPVFQTARSCSTPGTASSCPASRRWWRCSWACPPATASPGARHRCRRARADLAHDAGPQLPHPAVHPVPGAGPHRHALAADHHPPRHLGADRRLGDDGLLRDAAARPRGGGADRRRHALAGLLARSRCRWRARASSSARSSPSSSPGTISSSASCWPAARRAPCRWPSTTAELRAALLGAARRRRADRDAAGAAAHDLRPEGDRAGLTAGAVKGG